MTESARETVINWRACTLHKSLEVVCCLEKEKPHFVKIDKILVAGVDEKLPYAYCPQHRAFFGISADVDMKKKIIKLR